MEAKRRSSNFMVGFVGKSVCSLGWPIVVNFRIPQPANPAGVATLHKRNCSGQRDINGRARRSARAERFLRTGRARRPCRAAHRFATPLAGSPGTVRPTGCNRSAGRARRPCRAAGRSASPLAGSAGGFALPNNLRKERRARSDAPYLQLRLYRSNRRHLSSHSQTHRRRVFELKHMVVWPTATAPRRRGSHLLLDPCRSST